MHVGREGPIAVRFTQVLPVTILIHSRPTLHMLSTSINKRRLMPLVRAISEELLMSLTNLLISTVEIVLSLFLSILKKILGQTVSFCDVEFGECKFPTEPNSGTPPSSRTTPQPLECHPQVGPRPPLGPNRLRVKHGALPTGMLQRRSSRQGWSLHVGQEVLIVVPSSRVLRVSILIRSRLMPHTLSTVIIKRSIVPLARVILKELPTSSLNLHIITIHISMSLFFILISI